MRLHRAVLGFVLFAPLSTSVLANTYLVDAGGAGQFTSIQAAIDAAQPGDVILVNAGSYNTFSLEKGLVIIGYGDVAVTYVAQVVNVSSGERAALVHLRPGNIIVSTNAGAVVLQDMYIPTSSIAVTQSNDVRVSNVHVDWGSGYPFDSLHVASSRIEIVDSYLHGWQGESAGAPGFPTSGGHGGAGIAIDAGTRAHIARTYVEGGFGGNAFASPLTGGFGGPGILMQPPCEVFIVGPNSAIYGGSAGLAFYPPSGECYANGAGACAFQGSGDVHDSGTTIQGAFVDQGFHCSWAGGPPGYFQPDFCGPNDFPVTPADPSLQLTGTPTPGATVIFTVYGEPGASAVLNLGRNMILVPTPGVEIEQLAPANRVIPLGTIPASGSIMRNLTLPASFTPGLLFVAQAEVTGTNGLRRTNSTPIVVR